MKRRVVSAMLAAMMVFSVCTPALAATDVEVTTELKEPIYKVSVPTELTFYIDPFEQLGNAQITSQDLSIVNKSNVAVSVEMTLGVTADSGVTLKTTAAEVVEEDDAKLAFIQAEIPGAVTETPATGAKYQNNDWNAEVELLTDGSKYFVADTGSAAASSSPVTNEMVDITSVVGDYETDSSKLVDIDAEDGTILKFALAKADYTPYYADFTDTKEAGFLYKNVAADEKGSAVFRFSGKVNTLAAWADTDLEATVSYSFIGLTEGNYTTYTTDEKYVVAGAHAYVAPEVVKLDTTVTAVATDDDVTVTVKDSNDAAVVGATVVIKNESDEEAANGTTDENGQYVAEDLAAGAYTVEVTVGEAYNAPENGSVTVEEQNVAPSIEDTTALMAKDTDTAITVSLGSGDLSATGITSVTYMVSGQAYTMNAGTDYSFEGNTLTLKSSKLNVFINAGVTSRELTITFNSDPVVTDTITLVTE